MSIAGFLANLTLPPDRRYTKNHLWVATEEQGRRFCIIGPTEIVARRFSVVREVHLPNTAQGIVYVRRGQIIGSIVGLDALESRRATLPIHAPVTGVTAGGNVALQMRCVPARPWPSAVRATHTRG